ncbi:MAG: elongation factor G [SAR324 cluster bacterium]|nr:elongation factor G [SAR324 cluster bacterium]
MDISHIRNIGIVAHIDAGKTTTTERILFYSGKIHKIGEVDAGSTTMDWMPQEQERGITITSAATTCYWRDSENNYQINLIDTPGHVDFTLEVERSLRVMDGVVVVLCAASGVQPQTETVWRQADKFAVPRIVFVNKMDRKGADYFKSLLELDDNFSCRTVPINIPYWENGEFKGIIDLIQKRIILADDNDSGKDLKSLLVSDKSIAEVDKHRNFLLESASEFDDDLLEHLLEGKDDPPCELIYRAIRKGCLQRKIIPAFSGAAFKNKGVQNLISGVVKFLPSPLSGNLGEVKNTKGEASKVKSSAQANPLALLFKVQLDNYAGVLSYLRVYSGEIKAGKAYWNSRLNRHERVMKLYRIHSSKRETIEKISAGDIAAAIGFNKSLTGDTFSTKEEGFLLESIYIPQPVISIAVELKSSVDQPLLDNFLEKLAREDPSFRFGKDIDTGQTILSGMGELHLEVIIKRIAQEGKLSLNTGKQQVAYRETIKKLVECEEIFTKPLLGKPCFAKIKIEVSPLPEEGKNLIVILPDFVNHTELKEIIESGCKEALSSGILGGHSLLNVKVVVKEVEVDEDNYQSNAFKVATGLAIRKCLLGANCCLMEPQMKIAVSVPKESVGGVVRNLNQRQAKILAIEENDDSISQKILGSAPLSKMLGYTTQLRSSTQGKGVFSMEFDCFSPLQ